MICNAALISAARVSIPPACRLGLTASTFLTRLTVSTWRGPMDKVTVATELGPLAVWKTGEGPPLVLWHSLFLDRRSWDGVLPRLSAGVILINGPCHGESPGPGRPFTLEECADAAAAVLDHFGVARADWIGNAWGGH